MKTKKLGVKSKTGKYSAVVVVALLLALLLSVHVIQPNITGHATKTTVSLRVLGITSGNNCNLTLATGWNLVSMPCSTTNNSVKFVLGNISGSGSGSGSGGSGSTYYSVHNYDANDEQDRWKSYKPDLPSWVEQDLAVINASRGYWIRMLNNASLNITGTITLPFTIRLEKGWNLAGYPTNRSDTPASLFSSINSSITAVHAYNATDYADNWKAYIPAISGSLNDLTLIVPYWGYWINTTTAVNWQIPVQ